MLRVVDFRDCERYTGFKLEFLVGGNPTEIRQSKWGGSWRGAVADGHVLIRSVFPINVAQISGLRRSWT